MPTPRAFIIGSGPNGLSAAIVLARAGFRTTVFEQADSLGGGCRSTTRWGLTHDVCAAFHPTALASPFFQSLGLAVTYAHPKYPLAHPLPDGSGHTLHRDLELMPRSWQRMFRPLTTRIDALTSLTLNRNFRTALHHPRTAAHLARISASPATKHDVLFQGIAAHGFTRLDRPGTSAFGAVLGAYGHAYGWPVVSGGSGELTKALVATARHAGTGVRFHTSHPVKQLADLDTSPRDVVILNTTPRFAASFLHDSRQPTRIRRAYQKFRYGPAAFRVDFALRGDIPWSYDDARQAGTVHLGDPRIDKAVNAGVITDAPFTLVGQQYLSDPSRSAAGLNPIWSYAHVPAGFSGDATELIITQIERHAPGFRERIEHVHAQTVPRLEEYNPNCIGGDIAGGANNLRQLIARPVLRNPYDTGVPGVYLASASTTPGGGVHGMAGYHAARRAIEMYG